MYYFLKYNYSPKNAAILSHNDYEREVCENCGAIFVKYKGIFNFRIMGKHYDYYFASGKPVISEKFLNVLRENGFTGYEVSEAAPRYGTATMEGDPIKKKYYRLSVTGRCGLIRDLDGEVLPYCKICHCRLDSTGLVTNGVSFDPNSYDGSDIFAFEDPSNIPIVSEEIKDILIKSKLTNLRFVPLTEFVNDEKITKEYAIERIGSGATCPELIEAWLKYGVLTEQELNEQLDKGNL